MGIYEVMEERRCNEDFGFYKAYGIAYRGGMQDVQVSDLSSRKKPVEAFAKKLNAAALPPEQLQEVAEDWLLEKDETKQNE